MAEQRYQAVLEVILQGRTGPEVAEQWQVSRQTLLALVARSRRGSGRAGGPLARTGVVSASDAAGGALAGSRSTFSFGSAMTSRFASAGRSQR